MPTIADIGPDKFFFYAAEGHEPHHVHFSDDSMAVRLDDGRTLTVSLAWYPRLLHGRPTERGNLKVIGAASMTDAR